MTVGAWPLLRFINSKEQRGGFDVASSTWPLSYRETSGMQAHEHADELYRACPKWCIHWAQRGPGIMAEILHWAPDIGCLQEVDHPDEFDAFLQQHGCALPLLHLNNPPDHDWWPDE